MIFFLAADAARLARAGYVLAREGVLSLMSPVAAPPLARPLLRIARLIARKDAGSRPARFSAALSRLGPSYVKLGQFLATRPDVVGASVARDLEVLQDRMPIIGQEVAEATVAEAFERPVGEIYAQFGPAVAAASIAEVHKAEVADKDGTRHTVAVKILRPGVERRFSSDMGSFRRIAHFAETNFAEARRLRLETVVDTLARSVSMEMDLRLEAAAYAELAENIGADKEIHVPRVDWDRSGREVLTTEWIDGIKLSDKEALVAAGHDLKEIARVIMQSFLKQAMRDGFFHADMHPGNLFVDAQGRLVIVDCGIMGRLGLKERRFLAEILYGFITRNWRRTAEVHFEAGYVPLHHSVDDFALAIRAIGEPIHSRTADQISMARLLALLLEVTALFDMQTRPELLLLQKTMVVVEGVARSLDPQLDMWKTARPVVEDWIAGNLGPVGQLQRAGGGLSEMAHFATTLPGLLTRTARVMEQLDVATRDGLSLSPASLEGIGRAEAKRAFWGNLALWVIAAALLGIWLG
ncbi:2-polyprenylphenol 6-hydroxylase [Xanthobacter oligotrophicus]|uniref:2-polyprenylphenol 6-hydroxylase n=1 Tax=Xanthobacter oligotrophicus TaxID=2607286 RepID=UPI0011F1CA75|nr:2-polyprenylphenol 6-hydroxylase [Xanthobacter oligotrophicus]MCG5234967.1 2-polyprenylphenol 6-hydroxylase [Xanthobacter oligotrophicus]